MHKILDRQVRKFLGNTPVQNNWKKLLVEVSKTYEGYDKNMALLERSLDISSKELNEINKKLKKEADIVRRYLDIAGVFIVVIGNDQKVKMINKKGCEILGYDEKDIIGRNWFNNFLPKRFAKPAREIFDKIVKSNGKLVEYYENSIRTSTGAERLVAWHNTVLTDDNGDVISTLSSGEDITEREKNETALKRNNAELERFNKLMVDRELKMVKLKNEIIRLSSQKTNKE